MNIKLVFFSAACVCFMVPADGVALKLLSAAVAAKGALIKGIAGASGDVRSVVIEADPPPLVVERAPTLVPVRAISSFGLVGKLTKFLGGLTSKIGAKLKAVGGLLRGTPEVVLFDQPTIKKISPVVLEVGVPQHRVYSYQVPMPFVVEDKK